MAAERAPGHRTRPSTRGRRETPRVLVLAESLPFPTLKGGDLRTWQHVNALAACARVGVFGLCSNDGRRHTMPDLDLACWTTSTDAALASPPPKGVKLQARAWLLDVGGHPSDLFHSEGAAQELASLLASFRPDIVLVEGLWLRGYLGVARRAGCRVVLDCNNIEAAVSRELARTIDRHDLEGRLRRDVLPVRTEAIERAAVHAVDQLWVCSDDDQHRLRELYDPRVPIVVVPNAVRLEDYDVAPPCMARSLETPLTLVFPGIFSYPPNAIAARFLVDEIFPRLAAAHAACRLLLVGPMPTPQLLAASARDPRITVTGPVPDVRPYLAEATTLAAPLFQGGGTRLKILESFAARLPVVSTAKGAEGLGAHDRTHLLIAETADEFVAAALEVRRDPALAGRLVTNARALVAERFSWGAVGSRVHDAIGAIVCDA